MPAALITGASGGIGRACVRTLAKNQGYDVAIHYYSDEARARALADEHHGCWGGCGSLSV